MRSAVLKDVLRAVIAVLAAFLLYSSMGELGHAALVIVNGFSVVVIFFAVGRGEIFGAVLGTSCGLLQDAFSLGVFGVSGLSKTLLGFWTGYVCRRMDTGPPFRSGVFLLIMSTLELAIWFLINLVVFRERPNVYGGLLFVQPVMTAVLASLMLSIRRKIESRRS